MHSGRQYSLAEVSAWTWRETVVFLLLAAVPTALYTLAGWIWLTIPWLPIALVGTAVAFITGFKNNTAYGRLWEARQIWGGIVNASRTLGMQVMDFVAEAESPGQHAYAGSARERILHRHIGWLTALRFQLREPRSWENQQRRDNVEYRKKFCIPEWDGQLEPELKPLLSSSDAACVLARKNRATHLLALQSRDLRDLAAHGNLSEFRHVEIARTVAELTALQGRCERIKNFPYPRQFATINHFFVWLFIALVPFGLLTEFHKLGQGYVWLTVPASVIVSWVFHTMDKIGEASENPFEGGPNDIPISALSRTIEIDIREMLEETDLPAPRQPINNILM